MVKKTTMYVGVGLTTVLLLGVGSYFFIQNNEARKEKRNLSAATEKINQFIGYQEKKEFSEMAKLVEKSSLTSSGYTEKEMIAKYKAIYEGAEISKTTHSKPKLSKNGSDTYKFTYSQDFLVGLGEIKNQKYQGIIKKVKDSYEIEWSPSLIFPEMSGKDKLSILSDSGARGQIFDRNKKGLAINKPLNQVGIIPEELGIDSEKVANIQEIAKQFDVSVENINQLLSQGWVTKGTFVPIKIVYDEISAPLPKGVTVQKVIRRFYPLGEASAQLIGYVGNVTAEDIKKNPKLISGTQVGRTGLEESLDEQLRAKDGGKILILDEKGQEKSVLLEKEKEDGKDIELTIDSEAQKIAFNSMGNQKGATVVTSPKTGDLLVVASSPSYNPNKMANGISHEDYEGYANNPDKPFISRFSTRYAPGSTFKTITGAIGIDANTLDPSAQLSIPGMAWQKDRSWGDYHVTRTKEYTPVDLYHGMIYSDNIYFAQQTLKMGEDVFRKGLSKFIFGEQLELPIAMNPAQISNQEKFEKEVTLADTGYGQGQLLINPIQQITLYSVFANNGTLVYPKLIANQETKTKEHVISPHATDVIGQTLRAYVTDPTAFGYSLNKLNLPIGAKTGTAEVKASQDDTSGFQNSFLYTYDFDNHNYFTLNMFESNRPEWTAIAHVDALLTYLNQTYH